MSSDCVAGGANAALLASGHALVVAASIACAAIAIVFAFVSTAAKWIALWLHSVEILIAMALLNGDYTYSETMYTRTSGHAIQNLTFGIDATWTGMALFI